MQSNIDFDESLKVGGKAYNKNVGEWWKKQTEDAAHAYAYRIITNQIASLGRGKSPVILDYGCGLGNILTRVCRALPDASIYGLDGSSRMLKLARDRIKRAGKNATNRVKLIQTHLPDFSLQKGFADIVVYAFPHIVSNTGEEKPYEKKYRKDVKPGRYLAGKLGASENLQSEDDEELNYHSLFMERMVSRNIRGILKKGGICVRVEYSGADTDDPQKLELQLSGYQEGSSSQMINGIKPEKFFWCVSNTYYRSNVIQDVYHQTKEDFHQTGGYYLMVHRAV